MTKKKERELILNKYGGKCAYCGDPLKKGWHKDHIEPIKRDYKWSHKSRKWKVEGMLKPELDIIENMNPSCPSCNINKHDMSIEQFRNQIKRFINSLNLRSTQYKIAKRYGLIIETEIEVIFYFEKYTNNE